MVQTPPRPPRRVSGARRIALPEFAEHLRGDATKRLPGGALPAPSRGHPQHQSLPNLRAQHLHRLERGERGGELPRHVSLLGGGGDDARRARVKLASRLLGGGAPCRKAAAAAPSRREACAAPRARCCFRRFYRSGTLTGCSAARGNLRLLGDCRLVREVRAMKRGDPLQVMPGESYALPNAVRPRGRVDRRARVAVGVPAKEPAGVDAPSALLRGGARRRCSKSLSASASTFSSAAASSGHRATTRSNPSNAVCASRYASSIAAPPTPCLPSALTHPCRSVSRAASIQDATWGAKSALGSSAEAAGAPPTPGYGGWCEGLVTAEVGVVLIAHVRRHRGFLELAQRVDEVDRLCARGRGRGMLGEHLRHAPRRLVAVHPRGELRQTNAHRRRTLASWMV